MFNTVRASAPTAKPQASLTTSPVAKKDPAPGPGKTPPAMTADSYTPKQAKAELIKNKAEKAGLAKKDAMQAPKPSTLKEALAAFRTR